VGADIAGTANDENFHLLNKSIINLSAAVTD